LENFDIHWFDELLPDLNPLLSLPHRRHRDGSGDDGDVRSGRGHRHDSDHGRGRTRGRRHHRSAAQEPCYHSRTPHFLHTGCTQVDSWRAGWVDKISILRRLRRGEIAATVLEEAE
jgi:hypothetical protein